MHRVIAILLGTLLTGGASLCLGTVLFRKLRIQAERVEYLALAFVVGSACFSQVVFFLCSVGLARQSIFLAIGLLAATAALGLTRRIETRPPLPSLSRRWKFLLGLPFAIFGSVYLVNALAPEMSPGRLRLSFAIGRALPVRARLRPDHLQSLRQPLPGNRTPVSPCVFARRRFRRRHGPFPLPHRPEFDDGLLWPPLWISRSRRTRSFPCLRGARGRMGRHLRLQRRRGGGHSICALLSPANLGSGKNFRSSHPRRYPRRRFLRGEI